MSNRNANVWQMAFNASLQSGETKRQTDETNDVISVEQLAIYATFLRNQSISEHFIGLIPISKQVGAHL